MPDAIVVGAGPNGLVAANLLLDAGWDVLVLEAEDQPGGAVRSAEITEPGFVHDLFSAFYPLAIVSPAIRRLELERYGLRWRRAPVTLAHPFPDGRCPAIHADVGDTACTLDAFAAGDGDAWRGLVARWERVRSHLLGALFSPFPPIAAGAGLVRDLGVHDVVRFARFAMLPVRRMADEEFEGRGAGALLAGNALHTDLMPETTGSGLYGWLLSAIGQTDGFPVPEGGAGRLTDALVRRLLDASGELRCGSRVTRVTIADGRATGVRTEDGHEHRANVVLADVHALPLFHELVGDEHLPRSFVEDLGRFQVDNATFKIDWALDGPIPWTADDARRAGTVHVVGDIDRLSQASLELACRQIPAEPFLVLGQMSVADPSRSPPGKHVVWAYTHVPQQPTGDAAGEIDGPLDDTGRVEAFADRMERQIERFAPGFRDVVVRRRILRPQDLQARDANLVGGSINGGTAELYQQLVFRPVPSFGRPATPVRDLYLASSSAHPGGGVHGAPGANAVAAVLGRARRRRVARVVAGGAVALGIRAATRRR